MSALAERLRVIMARPQTDPLSAPSDARGWLELAYDRAYAEDHDGAVRAAEEGLAAVGATDFAAGSGSGGGAGSAGSPGPAALADPETVLALWGVAASVHQLSGEVGPAAEATERRVALLRALGRPHQADVELDLGPLLFREPKAEEAPLLQAALATHAAAGAPQHVLADIRLPLAVCRFEAGDPSALGELEACAADYRQGGRPESQAGALLFLAHGYAKTQQYQQALRAADDLLALSVNRAMRAAVWMVKAASNLELDHDLEAEGCAVRALELYADAGVRRGAVSAAALVANLASRAMDQDSAVAAWRIAVEQAERGEFGETWAVRLALGNQLMEAGEYLLAEEVLEHLAAWLEQAGRTADHARALMSLAHCVRHQERDAEALGLWDRAAAMFEGSGIPGDAARALLAAGTLESRGGGDVAALRRFERAVSLARVAAEADPGVLPQALHALGHSLCEAGDAGGLAHLDEAIALADEHGAAWHAADFRDTRARCLWTLGHGPAAVAAALEAADLYRAAEDDDGAGNSELFAAHVLSETHRDDESAQLYRLIAAEHVGRVAHYYAAQRGLSEVLARMGLPVQAEEARSLAEEALHRATDGEDGDDLPDGGEDGADLSDGEDGGSNRPGDGGHGSEEDQPGRGGEPGPPGPGTGGR